MSFLPDLHGLLLLLLGSLRVGVVLLLMPLLGADSLPAQIRVILAFALGFLFVPASAGALPTDGLGLVLCTGRELAIGGTLGLYCRILLSAPTLAGNFVAQEMGLMMAQEVDPTLKIPATPIGRLYQYVLYLFFLCAGVHHDVVRALRESFRSLPVGVAALPTGVEQMVGVLGLCLRHAIEIALPMFGVLLLATVVLALLAKSVPQLHIMNFGFALRLLTGLVAGTILFPSVVPPAERLLTSFREGLGQIVGGG